MEQERALARHTWPHAVAGSRERTDKAPFAKLGLGYSRGAAAAGVRSSAVGRPAGGRGSDGGLRHSPPIVSRRDRGPTTRGKGRCHGQGADPIDEWAFCALAGELCQASLPSARCLWWGRANAMARGLRTLGACVGVFREEQGDRQEHGIH